MTIFITCVAINLLGDESPVENGHGFLQRKSSTFEILQVYAAARRIQNQANFGGEGDRNWGDQ